MVDLWVCFQCISQSLIEAGELVLQQMGKDWGIWMWGMNWHDLTTKAMPVVEEFLRVMHRDEQSSVGHTWPKGRSHHTHQANLVMLGSHHSSDWDYSSNAPDSSYYDSEGDWHVQPWVLLHYYLKNKNKIFMYEKKLWTFAILTIVGSCNLCTALESLLGAPPVFSVLAGGGTSGRRMPGSHQRCLRDPTLPKQCSMTTVDPWKRQSALCMGRVKVMWWWGCVKCLTEQGEMIFQ